MKRIVATMVSAAVLLAAGWAVFGQSPSPTPRADSPPAEAVERTRKTVRMLDDIYKAAVVLITDKYVHSEDDFPAGSAAIALFEAVEQKGWHRVRLLDASGEPYDPENVAEDDFEKEGIKRLRRGEPYYDRVEKHDGRPHLRAITPIPVVMDKCVMCHPNYADAAEGQAVGAISYRVPIE